MIEYLLPACAVVLYLAWLAWDQFWAA